MIEREKERETATKEETQHQTSTIKHDRKISGGLRSAYMCVMCMDVCILEDVYVYIICDGV